MPAYARSRRIADDEGRWQAHLRHAGGATMHDPIKEHLHGSMTDLIGRLHHRGDARLKEVFRNQFVKCNKAMLSES
jgi:hypothetical protein